MSSAHIKTGFIDILTFLEKHQTGDASVLFFYLLPAVFDIIKNIKSGGPEHEKDHR
jgi:hypothetical protein